MALTLKGKNEAAIAAHRAAAWHTYWLLTPHAGKKGLPPFDKFCGVAKSDEPARPKTGAELEAIGRRWHAALNAPRKRPK